MLEDFSFLSSNELKIEDKWVKSATQLSGVVFQQTILQTKLGNLSLNEFTNFGGHNLDYKPIEYIEDNSIDDIQLSYLEKRYTLRYNPKYSDRIHEVDTRVQGIVRNSIVGSRQLTIESDGLRGILKGTPSQVQNLRDSIKFNQEEKKNTSTKAGDAIQKANGFINISLGGIDIKFYLFLNFPLSFFPDQLGCLNESQVSFNSVS